MEETATVIGTRGSRIPKMTSVVENCMASSACIFERLDSVIKEAADDATTVTLSLHDAKKMRRYAAKVNKAIAKHAKEAFFREDRMIVEQHLLRRLILGENIDREAARQRVFERIRVAGSDRVGCNALDKAVNTIARLDAALTTLSPTGDLHTHGATLVQLFE